MSKKLIAFFGLLSLLGIFSSIYLGLHDRYSLSLADLSILEVNQYYSMMDASKTLEGNLFDVTIILAVAPLFMLMLWFLLKDGNSYSSSKKHTLLIVSLSFMMSFVNIASVYYRDYLEPNHGTGDSLGLPIVSNILLIPVFFFFLSLFHLPALLKQRYYNHGRVGYMFSTPKGWFSLYDAFLGLIIFSFFIISHMGDPFMCLLGYSLLYYYFQIRGVIYAK